MLFTLGLTQISAEEATAQEAVKFYSNGKTTEMLLFFSALLWYPYYRV